MLAFGGAAQKTADIPNFNGFIPTISPSACSRPPRSVVPILPRGQRTGFAGMQKREPQQCDADQPCHEHKLLRLAIQLGGAVWVWR